MDKFTERTLPEAIRWLFEANGYSVEGPNHYLGAEVDLVATQLSGLTESRVYIEATVQYVDVGKYGKDLTKLALFRNEPGAQTLIVSSKGFTADVRERAQALGVLTLTYDELFKRFEKFEPYVRRILNVGPLAEQVSRLEKVYEEPDFNDKHGRQRATEYLTSWYTKSDENRWLVVVGEYGTGKTALTRVLQRRWLQSYEQGNGTPLPIRIELRDFVKQFDARGLLHHFLDHNDLSHLPISFVESMIADGRIVLLLDGYDEMAQYLNVRERRACLEALTELAHGGARGILTSRPNYFTEAEELRVFEVLYRRIGSHLTLDTVDRQILDEERSVDQTLDAFIMRRIERQLKDLTPSQARKLVDRHLVDDPAGSAVVIGILDRVFRIEGSGAAISLSGKPVIASYLLEVVEELKQDQSASVGLSRMSEWQIFDLIVEKLMIRDWRRTAEFLPTERRDFLRKLALTLTEREAKSINEEGLRQMIGGLFASRIRQKSSEGVENVTQSLFDDLRSSSTLTRSDEHHASGWSFSHNILREFLVVEELTSLLTNKEPYAKRLPITEAMRIFAQSMPGDKLDKCIAALSSLWPARRNFNGLDQMLSLIWSRLISTSSSMPLRTALQDIVGERLDLADAVLVGISGPEDVTTYDLSRANAERAEFVEADLSSANMSGMSLQGAIFDGCIMKNATLRDADVSGSLILDCEISDADCIGANFEHLTEGSTAIVAVAGQREELQGPSLLGYLRYRGAKTDPVDSYYVYRFHPRFEIAEKIFRYLLEGGWRQRRGMEQRGVAVRDVSYSRDLVDYLLNVGYITARGANSAIISATSSGRSAFALFVEKNQVDPILGKFFDERMR
ncbi:NACHT domain-containing protein [Micromonospora gifhornensis]|uniref:NACHT domain-containing protein n=1 Tax=Micromonospora gifhornensis TaxID=84594 RepID=UPI003D74A638